MPLALLKKGPIGLFLQYMIISYLKLAQYTYVGRKVRLNLLYSGIHKLIVSLKSDIKI